MPGRQTDRQAEGWSRNGKTANDKKGSLTSTPEEKITLYEFVREGVGFVSPGLHSHAQKSFPEWENVSHLNEPIKQKPTSGNSFIRFLKLFHSNIWQDCWTWLYNWPQWKCYTYFNSCEWLSCMATPRHYFPLPVHLVVWLCNRDGDWLTRK